MKKTLKTILPFLLAFLLLIALLLPALATASPSPAASSLLLSAVSAEEITAVPAGTPLLARLPGENGSRLLVLADPLRRQQLNAAGASLQVLDRDAGAGVYVLAAAVGGDPAPAWGTYGRVLWRDGAQVLLRTTPEAAARLAETRVEMQRLRPRPFYPDGRATAVITDDVVAAPAIQALIDQVTVNTVVAYDAQLSGARSAVIDGERYIIASRYTYSGEPIRKATQFVGQHLTGLGLDVTYHNWASSNYPNVIGELPGRTHPEQILLICAHLDDMPAGPLAPGADDNASGSSGVLAAADILSQHQWDVTLRFALWTGEEQGLLGSDAYAAAAAAAGEEIIGVLNMDMIGYNSESYPAPILDLHARSWLPNSVNMANLLADVVGEYELSLQPDVLIDDWLGDYSDNASFWGESYPAILVIEDYDDFNPEYHQVSDVLSNLDEAYLAAVVQAVVGTAAHIAGYVPDPPTAGVLTGVVSAADSGDPISGASVMAQAPAQTPLTTTTTTAGVYTAVLPADAYTLTVAAPDYVTVASYGISVTAGTTVTHNIALSPTTRSVHTLFFPLTLLDHDGD